MPHIHSFNRALLLLLFMWAAAAVLLLGYFGRRWERDIERKAARLAMQCAGVLVPMGEAELVQVRSDHSDAPSCIAAEASVLRAPAGVPRIRSSSLLSFERRIEKGLVSVIIPTYNRARIIGRAIESALAQSYDHLEVVVADDGSSDETRSVVEGYGPRVVYVRQSNAGVSAARNFGMRHAGGEFVAFLDSDDAWRPWKIEAQVETMTRRPEVGVVWTDMAAVDEDDRIISPRYLRDMYSAYDKIDLGALLPPVCKLGSICATAPDDLTTSQVAAGDLSSAILLGNLIHTSTVLFRRSWCERTGGFDETYERAGEDYEFYVRLTSAGDVAFIDAPSTLYRIGAADQLTAPAMLLEIARNNLRAVQKWLPPSGSGIGLSRNAIRDRRAESFAWLGEMELEAGHSADAARRLSRSLRVSPGLDRRAVLLASCVLPTRMRKRIRSARRALMNEHERTHSRAST